MCLFSIYFFFLVKFELLFLGQVLLQREVLTFFILLLDVLFARVHTSLTLSAQSMCYNIFCIFFPAFFCLDWIMVKFMILLCTTAQFARII